MSGGLPRCRPDVRDMSKGDRLRRRSRFHHLLPSFRRHRRLRIFGEQRGVLSADENAEFQGPCTRAGALSRASSSFP